MPTKPILRREGRSDQPPVPACTADSIQDQPKASLTSSGCVSVIGFVRMLVFCLVVLEATADGWLAITEDKSHPN